MCGFELKGGVTPSRLLWRTGGESAEAEKQLIAHLFLLFIVCCLLARAEEALKERKAAVSLPHVAIERKSTHSGVALRSAEGLSWVIEAGGFASPWT